MNMIPVEVQKPNKPESAHLVGEAPDYWPPERVARYVGVPDGCLVDGKIIKSRKDGDRRWSLVAYVEFG